TPPPAPSKQPTSLRGYNRCVPKSVTCPISSLRNLPDVCSKSSQVNPRSVTIISTGLCDRRELVSRHKNRGSGHDSRGRLVAAHKFRVDQRVTLAANVINRNAAGGSYVVTKQLPERKGEFEYRIKSASESHERVVRESELVYE